MGLRVGSGLTSQPNPAFQAGASSGLGAAATASPYAAAALAGYQVWSGLQQASVIRRQGRLTQQINEMNAQYAELDAYEAEKYGQDVTAKYETDLNQTMGAQKVAMASQNIDINFGTAKEIRDESKLTGFLNTLEIQAQGRARALGLQREARNIRLGGVMQQVQTDANAAATQASGIAQGAATAVNYYGRK